MGYDSPCVSSDQTFRLTRPVRLFAYVRLTADLGFIREEAREESVIKLIYDSLIETKIHPFKHFHKFFPVDEFYRWCSVTISFASGICGESSGGDDDAFVGASEHTVSEVTDLRP